MSLKPIKPLVTEADYDAAVSRIDALFEAIPGSPRGDELHILMLLVKEYDEKHFALENPDPIEAIKVRMDDLGWKAKDLNPFIGGKATVAKILHRKRPLTLEMVRNLSKALSLPAEVLISDYALAA